MKPTPAFLALLFTLLCTCVRAQTVSDNFEDGDLLNPEWTEDVDSFAVTNGRLRLMAETAGESSLAVRLRPEGAMRPDSFSFEFLIDMDFSPSGANYCTINLVDEASVGTITQSGIFMQLGGNATGSDDSWSGSVISGGDVILGFLNGTVGALGGNPAIARIRVTYAADFGYRFFADYEGGTDFQLQGTVDEPSWVDIDMLRLNCFYTGTRTDKFSFDDLNATTVTGVDESPPTIINGFVRNNREATIDFNEIVMPQTPANFTTSLAGNSITDVQNSPGQSGVGITFANPLPLREGFTVTIANLTDAEGNLAEDQTITLRYELIENPNTDNLIINEFMADERPVVGLPLAEYVELHNPSDTLSVRLNGIGIRSGGDEPARYFGDVLLEPGGYITVVDEDDAEAFTDLGVRVITLDLPALTNSGDEISLFHFGGLIQRIDYTSAWYNDSDRNDGGYSIEYTGLGADAGCQSSWKASEDALGGTPGRENSVLGRVLDDETPEVTGVEVTDTGVNVFFSEPIDSMQLTADLFTFSPALDVVTSPLENDGVFLAVDLTPGVVYTLTVQPDFTDCAGNAPTEAAVFTVGIADPVAAGDVVINELMFNPATGGAKYIELYNCSDKILNVEGWTLRNDRSATSNAEKTINSGRFFAPGDYLTLTTDPDDLFDRFLDVDPVLLLQQTLPSLDDKEGNLTVLAGDLVLDAFDYTEDFHSALLSPNDGVSLERLRQKAPTQDGGNWYSAASTEQFGTPTRPNSQARTGLEEGGAQTFSLVTTTFSPDGDGFEDILELRYDTDQPGLLARIRIYDAQGRLVRTLRQTELLGTIGVLPWDGSNDEGRRAKTGIYVLLVELVVPDGATRTEKLVGVLAGAR